MERVTFTNSRGQSVVISSQEPFFLDSISGTGASGVDTQMQKAPYQDGKTYIDTVIEPRLINIEVLLLTETQEEIFAGRRELVQVFNPKLGPGVLKYEYPGGVKEIPAVPDLAPVFASGNENRGHGFQKALISLICPEPFWQDVEESQEEMAAWIGGFGFPLELPKKFAESGQEVIMHNAGDVAVPVVIEFNGPALNPRVDNLTTGEFIRVIRALAEGEKLIIGTAFGKKGASLVTLTGQSNAMHWIDINSTFWQLVPGDNQVKYSADEGTETATVLVHWKNHFVGV
ncbi:MAG: phage tail family protein [Bacillota bacterium]